MAAPIRKFGVEAFQEAFDASGNAARQAAFDRFAETGLPHHKIEAWKYTSLVHLARTAFQPAPANLELNGALPDRLGDAARVVFINGRYSDMLSDSGADQAGR
jgi:Fe-S cluster assembly protein SufD